MKKFTFITLLITNLFSSSTFNDLKLNDEDFISISNSSKKDAIFDRINQLLVLKKSLKDEEDPFVKLDSVNNFFNEYKYISDRDLYKKEDYWATRKEFIVNGAGDCEDFVVAKYFTLLELGIEESKLSILHVLLNNQYHLVLGYQEDISSNILILDSSNKTILPLLRRDDLIVLNRLELIDLSNKKLALEDIKGLSNYKWSSIYKKSIN